MGEAIGNYAKLSNKRVLLLASGGMSHHPRRYYPEINDGPEEVSAWQNSGGEDDSSLSSEEWISRLEEMHHEGAEMIVKGERTAADMRLNEKSDKRFLKILSDFDMIHYYYEYRIYYEYIMDMDWSNLESSLPY